MPKRKAYSRKTTYKRRKASTKKSYKKRSFKKRSYKKGSKKSAPGRRPRTQGSYRTVPLQSAKTPRKGLTVLQCKWESPDSTAVSTTGVGYMNCQFFNNNNINPLSWTTGGDNLVGLDATLAAVNTGNTPRGLNDLCYNRFYYAMVVASSLYIKIARTGAPVATSDGFFEYALTPITSSDLTIFTPATTPPSSTTIWTGATPAARWKACRSQPGTVTGRLGNIAASDRVVHLRQKTSQSWFNTEPAWQAQANLWCSNGATLNLTGTYPNWYVLTLYQSSGNGSGGIVDVSITVDQKWYVKTWDPVPAQLITLRDTAISKAFPAPTKDPKESKATTSEEKDLEDDADMSASRLMRALTIKLK